MTAFNLVDTLRQRASNQGDQVAFSIGDPTSTDHQTLTFEQLDHQARVIASELQQANVGSGDRVVVMMPNSLECVVAVYGALFAGATAVPLPPPNAAKSRDRLESVLLDARPGALLIRPEHVATASDHLQALHLADRCPLLSVGADEEDRAGHADHWRPVVPSEVALLQYTSGSTADPKGVMVSHANIASNSSAIARAFGHEGDERPIGVCWVPLFHDMGIIGSVFHAVQIGGYCHLLDPGDFLLSPAKWLRAISTLGAKTAGGPNFGFDWCVDRVTDEQMSGVDLSNWSVAYNGSEPVRAETMDRFAERFSQWGFDRATFHPCYGLAEFTLLVTGSGLDRPGMTHRVDPAELIEGRVRSASDGGRELVASGESGPSTEVLIVDDDGVVLDDDQIGEILVSGPSRATGYWRNRSATARRFNGVAGKHNDFLRTGDLGYLHDGLLFVIGRRDEVIVVRGRNLYPHDLEAAAHGAIESRRLPVTAAFSAQYPTGNELVVLSEVARSNPDLPAVARDIRLAVTEASGVQPRLVGLVPRRTIPTTSSGKLRRLETANRLQQGQIELLHVDEIDPSTTTRSPRPQLPIPYRPASDAIETRVLAVWEDALHVADIGLDDSFLDLGGDSLAAAHIATVLSTTFQVEIDLRRLFEVETAADVAFLIRAMLDDEGEELVEVAL